MDLWADNDLDKYNNISSYCSTYGLIFISYVELCVMPTFQKLTYLNNPTIIKFSFSIDLNTSLPQIEQYGTKMGIHASNFGDPSRLAFHSLIWGALVGFQTKYVGKTFYCMTCQFKELTKNLKKCVSVCPTKVFGPSFKQLKTQDLK